MYILRDGAPQIIYYDLQCQEDTPGVKGAQLTMSGGYTLEYRGKKRQVLTLKASTSCHS